MTRTLIPALTALLLLACGDNKTEAGDTPAEPDKPAAADKTEADEAAPLDPRVDKAVTVANAIVKEPNRADEILEANGLDREKFEALMYEIAKDPDLSALYAVHRET